MDGAVCIRHALSIDGIDICVQNAVRDRFDAPVGAGFLIAAGLHIHKVVDPGDLLLNGICCVQRDLAAVRAVDLIGVLLRGVVACRDADACAA